MLEKDVAREPLVAVKLPELGHAAPPRGPRPVGRSRKVIRVSFQHDDFVSLPGRHQGDSQASNSPSHGDDPHRSALGFATRATIAVSRETREHATAAVASSPALV